ncbi:MAG: hypothetical protein ACYCZB_06305 [Acidiphilium sp.]
MRELTPEEVNAVSGGLSVPGVGGIISEVEGLVGSVVAPVLGLALGLVGSLVGSLGGLGGLGL